MHHFALTNTIPSGILSSDPWALWYPLQLSENIATIYHLAVHFLFWKLCLVHWTGYLGACGTLFFWSLEALQKLVIYFSLFPVLQSVIPGKTFSLFNQRQHYFFKSLWETLTKAFWKSNYVTASLGSLKVPDFPGNTLSTNATLTHSHCVIFI